MGGSIWLACCAAADMARVRHEIEAYDARARLIRLGDARDIRGLIGALGDFGGVVLYVRDAPEDVERAVGELACADRPLAIVVMLDVLDPGVIARLFHAGATEVIAAGDAAAPDRDDACAEEGAAFPLAGGSADRDGLELEEPPWDEPPCGADGERADGMRAPEADARRGKPGRGDEGDGPPSASKAPAEACDGDRAGAGADGEAEASGASRPTISAALAPKPYVQVEPLLGGAPLIVAISGRGGVGKTTVVASMAWWAAHMGLRAAVVDLDLMFGNQHRLMGVEHVSDLVRLLDEHGEPACTQAAIEATAMRIAPGLTLWGPCLAPEYAELLSVPCEQLIGVLRREADVIFVDTSVFWGDAVASAVSHSNRCLVMGTGGATTAASTSRAIALATRIGVPKTRMTCVFNRFGAHGCEEEHAMRFEMAVALRSRMRIADGGPAVTDMLAFGKLGDLMATSGAFTRDIQSVTYELLKELGCPVGAWEERMRAQASASGGKSRIRLPWKQEERNAS